MHVCFYALFYVSSLLLPSVLCLLFFLLLRLGLLTFQRSFERKKRRAEQRRKMILNSASKVSFKFLNPLIYSDTLCATYGY